MTVAVVEPAAPIRKLQGVEVPAAVINPDLFFERTSRQISAEQTPKAYAGLGASDQVTIRRSGILQGLLLRFSGSLVVTLGGGTCATTARWPHDLPRTVRFNANGQSNLISASGMKLKVREYLATKEFSDRGVSNSVGGSARTQGTLSSPAESWGVPSLGTGIAGGTYAVELYWVIPVADDEVDLAGSIFCATTSTDLELNIDWATSAQLFALTGAATAVLSGNFSVVSTKYTVPENGDGGIVIPDLSLFHQFVQSPGVVPANGDNEPRLSGQGPGKSLLRLIFQTWNNTGSGTEAPLVMNDTNYGPISWKYSNSEVPDAYTGGTHLREHNERWCGVDVGGVFGFGVHEFATQNALRDVVDLGTHSEIRTFFNIASGVSLSSPKFEYVQELLFRAGN